MNIYKKKLINNSLRLNSIANYFIELTDKNDFIKLHKFIKNKNLPVLVIGEGTNVVLPDIFEGIKSCEKNNPNVLVNVFYFLHEGAHVKTDINNDLIPALENSSIQKSYITQHIGTDQKMVDLILERAKEVEDAN